MGQASSNVVGRRNAGKDGWDVMRNKERQKVLAGLKNNVPDRYRELVEQYYKNLEEEEVKQ